MGPLTLGFETNGSSTTSSDVSCKKKLNLHLERRKPFASMGMREEKPFDFLRALLDGVIAGGTAGVVVETALYPIDTIKTRLQAVSGGGKVVLKGLYSGLAGNLVGVLPVRRGETVLGLSSLLLKEAGHTGPSVVQQPVRCPELFIQDPKNCWISLEDTQVRARVVLGQDLEQRLKLCSSNTLSPARAWSSIHLFHCSHPHLHSKPNLLGI